jgi:cell division septation protein DedD
MEMTSVMRRGLAVLGLGLLVLTGCDEAGKVALSQSQTQTDAAQAQAGAAGEAVERDIEAPEVFEVTDKGLWDGRPSLGGVWVAHPDVKQPERVLITNRANSKSVVGALFRRERETPGPILQVSSDAAVELGMLAGAPADISVVALRREKATVTPPVVEAAEAPTTPAPAPLAAPVAAPAGGAIEATPLEAVTGAAATAIDAAEIAAAARAQSAAGSTASPDTVPNPASAPSASSTLAKPYIQIGIFSLEQNARDAASKVTSAGMTAKVLAQKSQGKAFWRVIVGPASDASDRSAQLSKLKGIGFADAYPVTN